MRKTKGMGINTQSTTDTTAELATRFLRGSKVNDVVGDSSNGDDALDSRLYNVLSLISLFVGCLIAVCFLYILPRLFRKLRQRRQIRLARERAINATQTNDLPTTTTTAMTNPEERYASIENWLISKPVCRHDAICEEVQAFRAVFKSRPPSSQSLNSMKDIDDNDNDDDDDTHKQNLTHECSICYETFEEGDIVSWSPNSACENHVFHHGCIKEWLLLHTGCPYCRVTFLPVDQPNQQQIRNFIAAHQQRFLPAFFCQTHGIVRPPNSMLITPHKAKPVSANFQELCSRSHRLCCREELQNIRGLQPQPQNDTTKEDGEDHQQVIPPEDANCNNTTASTTPDMIPQSNDSTLEHADDCMTGTTESMPKIFDFADDMDSEVSPF